MVAIVKTRNCSHSDCQFSSRAPPKCDDPTYRQYVYVSFPCMRCSELKSNQPANDCPMTVPRKRARKNSERPLSRRKRRITSGPARHRDKTRSRTRSRPGTRRESRAHSSFGLRQASRRNGVEPAESGDMADIPDGIVLKRDRELVGRIWEPWIRRTLFFLLAAFLVLAF